VQVLTLNVCAFGEENDFQESIDEHCNIHTVSYLLLFSCRMMIYKDEKLLLIHILWFWFFRTLHHALLYGMLLELVRAL
jgi:hypothetical protein